MKLIIDIPDEEYKRMTEESIFSTHVMITAIQNGTPLDERDLISRQAVIECFKKWRPYMATRLCEFEKELTAIPSVENKGEWIPILSINEIPKEGAYWVTFEYENGYRETSHIGWDKFYECWDDEEGWALDNGDCIIAYMPYFEPEPYNPKSE